MRRSGSNNKEYDSVKLWQFRDGMRSITTLACAKFLGMSAYVLVSRAQVPMLQVETFATDYRKFTNDRIPPDLSETLDRGEVDNHNSFLFSLCVILSLYWPPWKQCRVDFFGPVFTEC